MWREHLERLTVVTADGVRLRAYVCGRSGPALVLASGLGGPVSAWRYQIAHFSRHYRVVSWDYRGLFGSELAHPENRVDVASHAEDLEAVLEQLAAPRAVVVGWSMGVQVALEHQARFPNRTSHLVLINGTAGRPFDGLPLPGAARLLPALLAGASRYHRSGGALLKRAGQNSAALELVGRMGALATSLPSGLLPELAREFSDIDWQVYLRTLRALGEHDAHELLGAIRAPTLIIAGGRDLFTPRKLAERMAGEIERAELMVVPRGTHYTATEFPDQVNQRIDAFLARYC